jgi:metal-responsive CopG/Arc/MetJ family transcriptional regulator
MENRKAISLKLPPKLLDELAAYCDRQPASPTRTAVVEAALWKFLLDEREPRARERQKERT